MHWYDAKNELARRLTLNSAARIGAKETQRLVYVEHFRANNQTHDTSPGEQVPTNKTVTKSGFASIIIIGAWQVGIITMDPLATDNAAHHAQPTSAIKSLAV